MGQVRGMALCCTQRQLPERARRVAHAPVLRVGVQDLTGAPAHGAPAPSFRHSRLGHDSGKLPPPVREGIHKLAPRPGHPPEPLRLTSSRC
jgi:hypothetical protein